MDTLTLAKQERQKQGPWEIEVSYGGEADLHQHFITCDKNPGHLKFIPVDEFQMRHLPTIYHNTDLVDLIRVIADLTVRVTVKYVSEDRPETFPGSDTPYPCNKDRGSNFMRVGTGWVRMVEKYPNKYSSYKTCDCAKCEISIHPKTQFAHIQINTAAHVVYDDMEGADTTCHLFFDSGVSPETCNDVFALCGMSRVCSNTEDDWCRLTYVTHDLNLIDKLDKMVAQCEHLRQKVLSKHSSIVQNEIKSDKEHEIMSGVQDGAKPGIKLVTQQPDIKSDKQPDIKSVKQPDIKKDKQPGIKTDKQADIKTDKQADIKTDKQANIKTDEQPDIKTDKQPDIKTDKQPDTKTDKQPDTKTDKQPDIKTDKQPDIKTDKQADIKTDKKADIKSDKQTDIKTDKQPDIKTDRQADIKTDKQADIKTDKQPDIKTDKQPDIKTDKQPDIKTDKQPDIKTDKQPDIKTDKQPGMKPDIKFDANSDTDAGMERSLSLPDTWNKLIIIVSHPHGCSKQVSVGHYINREKRKDYLAQYTYTTATCPGSSGARVFLVGRYRWAFEHVHSGNLTGNNELNFSGFGFTFELLP